MRFNSNTTRFILVLASLSLTAPVSGDGRKRLQLIGELNLSALIDELPGAERHSHSVSQVKISDDDQWIAVDVVAGHYCEFGIQSHHLLLVSADLKTDTAEQVDFDYRSAGGGGSTFFLSPDASLVAVEDGLAIEVENRLNRSSCSVAPLLGDSQRLILGGFINAELFLITRYRPGARENERTQYQLYDGGCKLRDSWELAGGSPAAASPEAGHIFVRRYLGGTRWETELVEWPSWKVVGKWPFFKRGQAADQGRVLCFESFYASDHSPVECRDLANGALLAKQVVVHGGYPLAVARSGTLAVANDWFVMWKPLTEGDYWVHLKRQMLWDIRSGNVLGSWTPKLQQDNAGTWLGRLTIERAPFVCALSSTGSFMVEAGDETIRVSRILAEK